ncbi:hypothetical protein AGMMS50230_03020 [Spirochaetia bacterium]|nr:hypothetical protein AGMMS50230_03020 [Spirochaetia bacterium]
MHKYILFIFLLLTPFFGWSQTGSEIETLLATPNITYAQAARLVLEASEAAVFANPEEAFRFAAGRGWLPKKAASNGTAQLGGIALLLMRSFDLKGGVIYRSVKNAHYAFRDIVWLGLTRGQRDPAAKVSGGDLLYMVNRLLALKEDEAGETR